MKLNGISRPMLTKSNRKRYVSEEKIYLTFCTNHDAIMPIYLTVCIDLAKPKAIRPFGDFDS